MNDFELEVYEKKKIARGAKHMKGKRGSRYVSLPHDHLTPAQLRKESGEVTIYNLNERMTWRQFKQMPIDLQKAYIEGLQKKYAANDKMLSNMFGVDNSTVWLKRKDLDIDRIGLQRPSLTQFAEWQAFCGSEIPETEEAAPEEPQQPRQEETYITSLTSIDYTWQGEWVKIRQYLLNMPAPDGEIVVEIKIRKENKE